MTPKQNPQLPRTLEPCEHMENWVNGLADGSLKGVPRLYTQFHVSTCSKCRTALTGLKDVHDRLHALEHDGEAEQASVPALTPERRESLETGMAGVEQRRLGESS